MNDALIRTLLSLLLAAGLSGPGQAQDNDKVRETVKRLETVLSQVDAHLAERASAETDLETAKAANLELRQRLTVAMAQAKAQERDGETLRAELAQDKARLDASQRAGIELQASLDQMRQREGALNAEVARLQQQVAARVPAEEHAKALEEARRQREAHEAAVKVASADLAQARAALSACEQEVAAQAARVATEQRLREDAQRTLVERDAELALLQTQRAREREAAAERAAAEQAAAQRAAAAQAVAERAAVLQAAATEAAESERQRARQLEEEVRQLRAQLDAASARGDEPPLQIHHHGSGNIILQIPARAPRQPARSDARSTTLRADADKGRIDE